MAIIVSSEAVSSEAAANDLCNSLQLINYINKQIVAVYKLQATYYQFSNLWSDIGPEGRSRDLRVDDVQIDMPRSIRRTLFEDAP